MQIKNIILLIVSSLKEINLKKKVKNNLSSYLNYIEIYAVHMKKY